MNTVTIVGAGPGAADLISVRGMRALEKADVVVYAGSLVSPEMLSWCREGCQCLDSSSMSLDEQVCVMSKACRAGKNVVRLHTGDPAIYGAVNEQIAALAKEGIQVSIIPGISSVFAAAAALGTELTAPGASQSVVLTRTQGRTPMPAREDAASFARTGATMVFFLSAGKTAGLMQKLMQEGNVAPDTPACMVYRVSWPDERIIRADVATLAEKAQEAGITRQALILVGKSLHSHNASSRLYADDFSHGYRNNIADESFEGRCAVYAFTEKGLSLARTLLSALTPASRIYCAGVAQADTEQSFAGTGLKKQLAENWAQFAAHIFIGAAGIAIRSAAPHLKGKTVDPAVISIPENAGHVIPLLSGHIGGANRLARRLARITGAEAVISTATDVNGLPGFDDIAVREQARILTPGTIKALNAALIEGKDIAFAGDKAVYERCFAGIPRIHFVSDAGAEEYDFAVLWDCPDTDCGKAVCLKITKEAFTLGIGCRRGVPAENLLSACERFLAEQGLSKDSIASIASCDVKKDEEAILSLAKEWGKPLAFYTAEELAAVPVPTPSQMVQEKVSTPSVCEAACLLSAGYGKSKGARIHTKKTIMGGITLALGQLPHGMAQKKGKGCIIVVGLGSGSERHCTPEVTEALEQCDVVAGYTNYLKLIGDRIAGKPVIQTGMRGEIERSRKAFAAALAGNTVCMVCSGDPGILAMAGLIYELKIKEEQYRDVQIRVLPGITAASIAAARLGAPLQNGFCILSLSDLLIPADEVRRNMQNCAMSALPLAIYNPAGRNRRDLLAESLEIFRSVRGDNVLCAYVKNAGRQDEEVWTGKLCDFPAEEVDMSTLIIIGGPRTCLAGSVLYEARGYMEKYRQD